MAARRLIPEQRHQEIVRLLRREGVLSIHSLTDYMNVSHMTVRRDITALEALGLVIPVQGGVRLAELGGKVVAREREVVAQIELPRHQAIAELAAQFVEDESVVFLDAGRTCRSMVPCISTRKNLTVITNDFHVVSGLSAQPHIEVIHTGGAVDASSASSQGPLAAAAISGINVDLFFLSTDTWSLSQGVTASTMDEVEVKLAAFQASTACILLADSAKFGTVSKFRVAPIDKLDAVITDEYLTEDIQENIRELGVIVTTAELYKKSLA